MSCPPIAAHRWSPSPRTRWCSPTLLLIDRPGPPDALALPLVLAMAFASPLGALLLLEVVPRGQPVPSVHLKWQHRKTLKNNTKHKNFELKTITLKWRNSQVNSQVNLSESNPQVNSQSEWNPQVNSQSEWPPKWSLKVNEALKWTLRMKMKPSSELSKWRQHSRNKIVNEVVVKHSRNTRLWQWPSTWLSLLPLGQHHLNQHLELSQTLELPQALAWPWPLVLPQLEQLPPRHLLCPWMHTYIFPPPPLSLSLSLTLSLSLSLSHVIWSSFFWSQHPWEGPASWRHRLDLMECLDRLILDLIPQLDRHFLDLFSWLPSSRVLRRSCCLRPGLNLLLSIQGPCCCLCPCCLLLLDPLSSLNWRLKWTQHKTQRKNWTEN